MPARFMEYCLDLSVIVGCTEIRCESPISLTLKSFSTYKNHTFKVLIGIAPYGVITFVSKLFTGSISDEEITRQSGILRLREPGDVWPIKTLTRCFQMLVHASSPLHSKRRIFQQSEHRKLKAPIYFKRNRRNN